MSYKHIIFDFDGVLAESNQIRFEGFRLLFKSYPKIAVEELMQYVMANSGMPRFDKIRYFFKEILRKPISEEEVERFAGQYSQLVKQKVIEASPVRGSLEFLSAYDNDYDFAVVSGSEERELQEVCRARGIDRFFVKIMGSPAGKESNLAGLLKEMGWNKEESIFIGDSINDLEAAEANKIDFIGRNSEIMDWSLKGVPAIDDISELYLHLT